MARLAGCLETLRTQIDEAFPDRSKVSDGWIGDPAHAARNSHHNPNAADVVCAIDLTDDPEHGADMATITEAIRKSRDPRVTYVIFSGRMYSSYNSSTGRKAWEWGPYTGINAHEAHAHISSADPANYDNDDWWQIGEEIPVTKDELRKIIREEVRAIVAEERKILAVGRSQKNYDPEKVNLKAAITKGSDA
jgi:hypothetical protein